jgi:uncharacterized Zn finger protein (UPF0148 family)
MQCKCKFFLRNEEGKLYCTQCGKLAHDNIIEDKAQVKGKKRIVPKGTSSIGG